MIYAKDQMLSTFKKVFPYILIGVGIGAVIHNWIPEEWVAKVLGSGNPFGVVLATLVGVPMYADIFGTIPIAEALLSKGAQLGTILSFMVGYREKIGRDRFGTWRNTVLMEKRSKSDCFNCSCSTALGKERVYD